MRLDLLVEFFDGCGPLRSEVAFAYDPEADAARELGEDVGRRYERRGADMAREVCGATDLFAVALDRSEVRVLDMKGRSYSDPWQLRAQAVAVSRRHGIDRVVAVFAYHQEDGGFVFGETMTLTALELDGIAGDLRAMKGEVARAFAVVEAGREPDVSEGPWCRWCPAFKHCRAKVGLVGELTRWSGPQGGLDEARAAQAAMVLERFADLVKAAWAELYEYARTTPIRLPDGRTFGMWPGRSTEMVVDVPRALDVLWEQIDEHSKMAVGTDKTSIEEAVKAWARANKKPIGKAVETVMQELRGAGALQKRPGEVKPRFYRTEDESPQSLPAGTYDEAE